MKYFFFIACLMASASCFSQIVLTRQQHQEYVPVKGDTVELHPGIHFIKVDGKVYEIKRNTSIQEAQPPFVFPQGMQITPFNGPSQLIIPGDTMGFKGWRINTYVGRAKSYYTED